MNLKDNPQDGLKRTCLDLADFYVFSHLLFQLNGIELKRSGGESINR